MVMYPSKFRVSTLCGFVALLLCTGICIPKVWAVESGRDLILGAEEVENVSSGRDTQLNGTTVMGNVKAGREVSGQNCQVQGDLTAGRDVHLMSCDPLQSIRAGRDV